MTDKTEDVVIWSADMIFWDEKIKETEKFLKEFRSAVKMNEAILELCKDKFAKASKEWEKTTSN